MCYNEFMRNKFEVSVKIAIFNQDKTKILLMYMNWKDTYGLPGGHLEKNETITECLKREVYEETGLKIKEFSKKDFFFHSNKKKIILAYVTFTSDKNDAQAIVDGEGEPMWIEKQNFLEISNIDKSYKKFVLDIWNK